MSDISGDDMSARSSPPYIRTSTQDHLTVLPPGRDMLPDLKESNSGNSASNLDIGPNICTPDMNTDRKS